METLSKPIYIIFLLLIVFFIGISSGLFWAKIDTRPSGFIDVSQSIKTSGLPISEGKFVTVTKDNEKFSYKLRKEHIDLNISKKNVLYVVDLNGKELEEIQLKEGFDLMSVQFIFAGTKKLYFFEGKDINGLFIPRR